MSTDAERLVHGLRVRIDRALCVGFGDCVRESPRAFQLDDENLVGPDAEASITQTANRIRVERQRFTRRVEHDEIIARALHLGEAQFHARIMAGISTAAFHPPVSS